jgi:hypothetical protein
MLAFAEQMEIEVRQDRRKAIGVFHLDLVVAEAGAQAIVTVAGVDMAGEETGVVDARQVVDVAGVVENLHGAGVGQEDAHDRPIALDVPAEVVERIGVVAVDDGFGRGREAHD